MRVDHTASELYNTDITRDCETCTSWVKLAAYYNDPWQTPMAGAAFRLKHNGQVIEENTLKSLSDIGKTPGDPLTDADRAELGTFTKQQVPPGPIEFEIVAQGSEGQILQLEERCKAKTVQAVTTIRNQYESKWQEWEEATAAGRAQQLLTSTFEGFLESVGEWWEEEQGFWDMIGSVFADAWDAIVDALGSIADALHPDNIARTAQMVWDGARAGAQAVGEFVSELPDRAREFYPGTVLIIQNMPAIVRFMRAFVSGDWRGVEQFVTTTLPLLIEDDAESRRWGQFINNNAEAWQVVLEIVGYTKGPALITAACAGICAAIPPQVWAEFGVASVTTVAIEVAISAVIGFLATSAEALSGGAATAAVTAVIVGRTAKWARMGNRAARSIRNLLRWVDEIIEMVVEMGQAAVRGRRRMTRTNGRRGGSTAQTNRRRRDDEDDEGRCGVCNRELGANRHPRRTPDRDGVTGRSGSGRRTTYGPTGRYSDATIGQLMKAAQSPTHPTHLGVSMTHHHILMVSKVDRHTTARKLRRLGYVVHDPGNLVLMPNHMYGACHLEVQMHRSRHTSASIPTGATRRYNTEIDQALRAIGQRIRRADYCRGSHREIQSDLNNKSEDILDLIKDFDVQIQNGNSRFAPRANGCGDCGGSRNHGPGATDALRRNGAAQSTANTVQSISYPKAGQWTLATGR